MSLARHSLRRLGGDGAWRFLPLAIALIAAYIPTYLDVARKFWAKDEDAFGPIILLIVAWLCWRERAVLRDGASSRERLWGGIVFGCGLVLYVIGRSQEFFQFDIGSQPLVLMGIALVLGGVRALKRYWFPACFLLLLVPVPPSLLDQVLVPLKVTVSQVVTDGLYWMGYPISRAGVVLVIGQYPLLIANACSGLRSMVALSCIGLLFVYVSGKRPLLLNACLLAAAIPIAFLANVSRVTALVLITYYFGDDAGTRFHDLAGYFEIALAFGAFFALDFMLSRLLWRRALRLNSGDDAQSTIIRGAPGVSSGLVFGATGGLVCAAVLAIVMAPNAVIEKAPDRLAVLIPPSIGNWTEIPASTQQVSLLAVDEGGEDPMQRAYDDSLLRTYSQPGGRQMMVAIAYDRVQREEDRVHRPEICYMAQGFTIVSDLPVTLRLKQGDPRQIEGRRMITRNGARIEAVSFWIRIGDTFTQNPWRSRIYVIQEGLAGRLHDGILVRVSELIASPSEAPDSFERQEKFLDELIAHLSAPAAQLLASNAQSSPGGQ